MGRVEGNEEADSRARRSAWLDRRTAQPEIATPAGIRQAFPIHSRPRWLKWDRQSLKGLTYIVTDRGLLKRWLWVIGPAEDDKCECGVAQNAAHLLRCSLVGDGKGRTVEEAMEDREWCRAIAEFLS